ncbi:hypothetical protein JTE90_017533 [Oedothorax gibbosus]|uniref:Uncharacterized protein n=1 Tax=Oedothorax gibbosus TaxID=931172 RepID=A0AAV6TDL3_9ARAC|nr:hypothetical protein JTE90_017533 [Oedothorax gibbosus]
MGHEGRRGGHAFLSAVSRRVASVGLGCAGSATNTRDKRGQRRVDVVGGSSFSTLSGSGGEYMKEVAKSGSRLQIKVFSSIPMSKVPNDMDSLKEALNKFPDDLANFNKGGGIPIRMELWPLSLLDKSLPEKIRKTGDGSLDMTKSPDQSSQQRGYGSPIPGGVQEVLTRQA